MEPPYTCENCGEETNDLAEYAHHSCIKILCQSCVAETEVAEENIVEEKEVDNPDIVKYPMTFDYDEVEIECHRCEKILNGSSMYKVIE